MKNTKEIVKDSKVFEVKFTKKSGELRTMLATNKSEVIEKFIGKQTFKGEKRGNDEVCTVLDLQKQEFRCFRWDSVVGIKKIK